MPNASTTANGEPKKSPVCTKVYIQPDKTETRTAHPAATVLEFRFHDGPKGEVGTVRKIAKGDNPENVEKCLDWMGRSEKYGNFYAGAKGVAADALMLFDGGAKTLAGGEWSERKEGVGPAPTMVLAAVVAFLEAQGETVDDARKARVKEKVSSAEGRKGALANPAINAEYETIRALHAAQKAKEAKSAAKGVAADTSGF